MKRCLRCRRPYEDHDGEIEFEGTPSHAGLPDPGDGNEWSEKACAPCMARAVGKRKAREEMSARRTVARAALRKKGLRP